MPRRNETFGQYCGEPHPTDPHRSCVVILSANRVHKVHRTVDGQSWPVKSPAGPQPGDPDA